MFLQKTVFAFVLLFDFFFLYSQNQIIPYYNEQQKKYGYKQNEKIKIKPSFIQAGKFINGFACIKTDSGINIINTKGKILFKKYYKEIGWHQDTLVLFQHQLTKFKHGKFWGLINKKGKEKVSPQYDSIGLFYKKITIVKTKNARYGLINTEGNQILPTQFKLVSYLGNSIYTAQDDNLLWGFYTLKGENIYPHQLSKIFPFKNGKSKAIKNYHYGLLDSLGIELLPFIYKDISLKNNQWYIVPFPKYEIINRNGEQLNTFFFDTLENIAPHLYYFTINKNKGFCNEKGKVILYNMYDTIYSFKKDLTIVKKDERYGLINQNIKEILKPKYSYITFEPSGLIRTYNHDGKENLFTKQGKNITQSKYSFIGTLQTNFYNVKDKTGKWFYIDTSGVIIENLTFDQPKHFIGKYTAEKQGDLFGIIDKNKNWVISPLFDSAFVLNKKIFVIYANQSWSTVNAFGEEKYNGKEIIADTFEGMLLIKKNQKYGLVNHKGSKILDTQYDSISSLLKDNIFLTAWHQGKKIYINTNEKIQPQLSSYQYFSYLGELSQRLIPAKINQYYGFIDYLARMRIAYNYDSVKNFSEGLAAVKLAKKWGFINREDELIIQPYYDGVSSFKEGKSIVKLAGKYGVINQKNEILIPLKFDSLKCNENGNWSIFQNGKQGLISADIRHWIYPKYEKLIDLGNEYIISYKNNRYGLDNIDGLVIILPKYNQITLNSFDTTFNLITYSKPFFYKKE